MKRFRCFALILAAACLTGSAQNHSFRKEDSNRSNNSNGAFDEFRKGLLDNYDKFKKSVLDDYDRFLDATWESFQQMRGQSRYEIPKPHDAPVPDKEKEPSKPVKLPQPGLRDHDKDKPKPSPRPDLAPIGTPVPAPVAKPDDIPAPEPLPTPSPFPDPMLLPDTSFSMPTPGPVTAPTDFVPEFSLPTEDLYTFPFYGMDIKISDKNTELKFGRQLSSAGDFGNQWRSFKKEEAHNLIPAFKHLASVYGLNDYLTFRLIRSYINSRYPDAHPTARVALEHYLLANMGYDVRVAIDDSKTPLLLIPFSQDVYARPFLMFGSQKYYVYQPDGIRLRQNASISTCKLPSDVDLGRPLDLRIEALALPEKPKEFSLSYGDLTLTGEVNENVMNVVYEYPQMSTSGFAVSQLSPALRADLVDQLKQQLAGLNEREAVDKLLQFTQSAFDYATDQDFHGFEKPYFLEEILYYPKCDCEDRSIFYTYMLWNVLGVENHLLAYPGHESASVHLNSSVKGDGYEWQGKTYYISDPTYIGSVTGMCMPTYSSVSPDIDLEYK